MMTITLTLAQEAWVHEQVASGRYASATDVLRAALELLDEGNAREHRRAAPSVDGQGRLIPFAPGLSAVMKRDADERARLAGADQISDLLAILGPWWRQS